MVPTGFDQPREASIFPSHVTGQTMRSAFVSVPPTPSFFNLYTKESKNFSSFCNRRGAFSGRDNKLKCRGGLQMKTSYTAEWIDLLSPDTYESNSPSYPGKIDPPRSGAVSFSLLSKGVFTFGGYSENSGEIPVERHVVNDIWQFIPFEENGVASSSWGWTKVLQRGNYTPGPRLATAMALIPEDDSSVAVLFGGWDPQNPGTGGIILDDVSVLNIDIDQASSSPTLQWFQPTGRENEEETVAIPGGPCSRHIAVTISIKKDSDSTHVDDMILLHNHRCDDHVFLFSSSSTNPDNTGKPSKKYFADWKCQSTSGKFPSSRGLHCASTLDKLQPDSPSGRISKAVVLFGGAAKDGAMSNEAFVLDLTTWRWSELDCANSSGSLPSPRAGACLCSLDGDSVLLFGGAKVSESGLVGLNDVWVLRVDIENGKGIWECLVENQEIENADKISPPGRNAATLTRIDAKSLPTEVQKKGKDGDSYFLLQGGWYPFVKTYNDVFALRISSKRV